MSNKALPRLEKEGSHKAVVIWSRILNLRELKGPNRSAGSSLAAMHGARKRACAAASVTPLWQDAENAPGQVSDRS